MNLKNSVASILVIAIIAVATFAAALTVTKLLNIEWSGTIPRVTSVTANTTTFESGSITLGMPIIESVELTNTGTKNVTLNMTYTTSANLISYTLTWDCEDEELSVGYYIIATFTLTVTEAQEGLFTIDIAINDKTP